MANQRCISPGNQGFGRRWIAARCEISWLGSAMRLLWKVAAETPWLGLVRARRVGSRDWLECCAVGNAIWSWRTSATTGWKASEGTALSQKSLQRSKCATEKDEGRWNANKAFRFGGGILHDNTGTTSWSWPPHPRRCWAVAAKKAEVEDIRAAKEQEQLEKAKATRELMGEFAAKLKEQRRPQKGEHVEYQVLRLGQECGQGWPTHSDVREILKNHARVSGTV